MAVEILVPVSTEVIEEIPECVISGEYKDGALVISMDARKEDHHSQHGLSQDIEIHWGKEYTVPVQELSGLAWPFRYEVTTGEGWYLDKNGNRRYLTPKMKGLNLHRRVSDVVVTKSTVDRWIDDVADGLPTAEGHLDELFPRGRKGKCELVLRDEYGRIIVVEEVAKRDEEHVKPFLLRLKGLGLSFYVDHCKAYRNAIIST